MGESAAMADDLLSQRSAECVQRGREMSGGLNPGTGPLKGGTRAARRLARVPYSTASSGQ